jgi:hypothetical protein
VQARDDPDTVYKSPTNFVALAEADVLAGGDMVLFDP